MSSVFDWVKSINDKTDMDTTSMGDYQSFIVNRSLSYFQDCVLWVNEVNRLYHLDKDIQYSFLKNTISKRKRFSKWTKADTAADIECLKEYYKVSRKKASEILPLLNKEQLEQIRGILNRGGRNG